MQEFSFASVVLSYFLVGGGMCVGTLLIAIVGVNSEIAGYTLMAAGAFLGGFVAARASRGSTVLEPAIGAIAVVGTVVGLAAGSELGQLIWHVAHDETIKFIAIVGATSTGGAIAGAFLSEKLFGEATRSTIPWLLYTAMATFGACLLGTIVVTFLAHRAAGGGATIETATNMLLVGIAAGCLLAGIAVGASARTRPLLTALVGGGLGVAGYFLLIIKLSESPDSQTAAGLAVLAVGGGVVTLVGTLIGWAVVGQRHAG